MHVPLSLHAFRNIFALEVDAGRYPSLPRFLQELRELRESRDDAPDEGRLGVAGDAVRIYTVHESKGLEANIVWLLDANGERKNSEGYDVLLDWPAQEQQPLHFSLYADLASRGKKRAPIFEHEAAQQAREDMNLLYVAMTRARQALIVSGNGRGPEREQNKKSPSWYDRIASIVTEQPNPLAAFAPAVAAAKAPASAATLPLKIEAGKRKTRPTPEQLRGIRLHALLQHVTVSAHGDDEELKSNLRRRLAIPSAEMEKLWPEALALLAAPGLVRFFDAKQYQNACNEMPYVNAKGELKRLDRLVEFENEVWVLDYKMGESADIARYRSQMEEYRAAMQAVYAGKTVRCALVFGGGVLKEV